jgi:hypothetical protein
MPIVRPIIPVRTDDPAEIRIFLTALADLQSYLTYPGDPTGVITPRWYSDRCFNTVDKYWYINFGSTSADWVSTNAGGDHSSLTGLTDDDHFQYLKEKASGGIAAEIPVHTHASAAEAGTLTDYTAASFYYGIM